MKRTVPMVIAGITGFVVIIAYFIPYTEDWGDKTMIWFDILAGVAFVLGGANILKVNLQKISFFSRSRSGVCSPFGRRFSW